MNEIKILILGYGNPGRQDDGLGPAVAEGIEALDLPKVTVEANYQLNIEDAALLAEHDVVLFVDASKTASEPWSIRRILPASTIAFTSHSVSPESVLAICEDHFNARPKVWVLEIRGYAFERVEGLTREAQINYKEALVFTQQLIQAWKEHRMESGSEGKKTILTIDDDPDIRATLRIVLEMAGYAVGEASNGKEGLKIAEKIQPDAIIVDLMMEEVDSGSVLAQKLKESGYKGPVYLLSAAGDTVRYNVGAREMGLAGIFQKPIDPKTLVTTLQAKLKG